MCRVCLDFVRGPQRSNQGPALKPPNWKGRTTPNQRQSRSSLRLRNASKHHGDCLGCNFAVYHCSPQLQTFPLFAVDLCQAAKRSASSLGPLRRATRQSHSIDAFCLLQKHAQAEQKHAFHETGANQAKSSRSLEASIHDDTHE